MNLAPIILFVYNRPWHTEQALSALADDSLAKDSILYIYADGPKDNASEDDEIKIAQTRKLIREKQWCKEVYIIESEKNKGLADSVISGTTEIVNQYGKVITLEDDVIVSKHFLKFMNESLNEYSKNEEIFGISGYIFPVNKIKRQQGSFFLPITATQAWATWKRAWNQFDSNPKDYSILKANKRLRQKFNLDDSYDYSTMLITQMESKEISSWAIMWWWSVFKRRGLLLYPDKSLIKNIGWDGSGRHSGKNNPFFDSDWSSDYSINKFPSKIEPDEKKLRLIKKYLKHIVYPESPSFIIKIFNRLRFISHD